MDDIDKKILNFIQTGFPITHAPYAVIGEKTGITEDEAFERVKAMKESGVIRRIGASFDSRGLGWTSTLCAMKVPPEHLADAAKIVAEYHEVTHNYERNHEYNLWFTLIAPEMEDIDRILREIGDRTGFGPVRDMPALKLFKIKLDFKFKEDSADDDDNGDNGE